jgi:hypothetical protein
MRAIARRMVDYPEEFAPTTGLRETLEVHPNVILLVRPERLRFRHGTTPSRLIEGWGYELDEDPVGVFTATSVVPVSDLDRPLRVDDLRGWN